MKKFLLRVFLFVMVLLAGVVVLFVIPVDRKYAYDFISKGGCQGRPPWIYQKIFEDTTNIDVAFIGTSHTMAAVNDYGIESALKDSTGEVLSCRNLSFCGFGRDFDYAVIKDLLEHKKVKAVVLELRESESQLGHLSFPYVASTPDLFNAPKYFNRSYIPAVYKAFLFRLQYLREIFTHEDVRHKSEISNSLYGYREGGDAIIADEHELEREVERSKRKEKNKIASVENALNSYPMSYVNQIAELAASHRAKLIFLYLPAYDGQANEEEIRQKYSGIGPIIFPGKEILSDKSNWADHEHFNKNGAAKVSKKISEALRSI